MEILKQLFSENDKLSLTRILSTILVLIPLTFWLWLSISKFMLIEIPESVVILMSMGFGGKIADGFLKGKNNGGNV